MWPCKDIDFSWSDVIYAVWMCMVSSIARSSSRDLGIPDDATALPCMSVRAAFDLYLTARQWGHGDECIFVGVNVPDMFQIAESYGLSIRCSDIDPITTQADLSQLRANINPRTRFIVIPHLFGHRLDLRELIAIADAEGLDVVEDCAQAFVGRDWWGTHGATLSLFSFGPMKTATALQGAVSIVRNENLFETMANELGSYSKQANWRYLLRVIRFAVLKLATQPLIYGLLVRVMRMLSINHEAAAHASTKSASRIISERLLRTRPSRALLRVIERQINRPEAFNQLRISKGSVLHEAIGSEVALVLRNRHPNSYWMVPVLASDPERFKNTLRAEGFDAMSGRLVTLNQAHTSGAECLANAVMLPFSPRMPESEYRRMGLVVTNFDTEPFDSAGTNMRDI